MPKKTKKLDLAQLEKNYDEVCKKLFDSADLFTDRYANSEFDELREMVLEMRDLCNEFFEARAKMKCERIMQEALKLRAEGKPYEP